MTPTGDGRSVFYDPYLATAGGGEKYLLSILARVTQRRGRSLLVSPTPPDDAALSRLAAGFTAADVDWRRGHGREATRASDGAQVFVTLCNTLVPQTRAQRAITVLQFPWVSPRARNPAMRALGREQVKRLASYEAVVCYSEFVAENIRCRLGIPDPVVLPPAIAVPVAAPRSHRSQCVLAVGRFFPGRRGNNKKYEFMIDAWKGVCQSSAANHWTLHLVGGLADDLRSQRYFARLQRQVQGLPIVLHPNAPRSTLDDLYRTSAIFWHAAGYGETQPERFEHFGISTLEAMAAGCVPVVVGLGGGREIVAPTGLGTLWRSREELISLTRDLMRDDERRSELSQLAWRAAARYRSSAFEASLDRLLG